MRNQLKYVVGSVILLGAIIYLLAYMYGKMSYTLEGVSGTSNSLEESKQRKMYVSKYEVIPNPIIINDSIKLEVKDCWVEKNWFYGSNYNETKRSSIPDLDRYTLIIKAKDSVIKYDYWEYFEFYKFKDTAGFHSDFQNFNGSLENRISIKYPNDKLPLQDTFHIYSNKEKNGTEVFSGVFVVRKME
jgi:hypothetical protein